MANGEMDTLVVVSKLKNYIRDASGMNTAGNVAPALSDIIRRLWIAIFLRHPLSETQRRG
jgi:hypothetical protein